MLPCLVERGLLTIRDGLISLAYPQDCRLCSAPVESFDDGVVCHRCWADPEITRLFDPDSCCPKCGIPLQSQPLQRDANQAGTEACSRCARLSFSAARACGAYSGALEASILFLKSHPHVCRRLRNLIERTVMLARDALSSDLVVPMPLHRTREKERGFNQAAMIAQAIARFAAAEINNSALLRTKHTERHRAGMDSVDRARSVEGAFRVADPAVARSARVLLVDDVYTTGSTACAAAAALLKAGATRVALFTIARVV